MKIFENYYTGVLFKDDIGTHAFSKLPGLRAYGRLCYDLLLLEAASQESIGLFCNECTCVNQCVWLCVHAHTQPLASFVD